MCSEDLNGDPSARRRRTLVVAVASVGLALPVLLGGGPRPALGQTAGPVATRTQPIVAGPRNGGVAVAPESAAPVPPVGAAPGTGNSSTATSTGARPVTGGSSAATAPAGAGPSAAGTRPLSAPPAAGGQVSTGVSRPSGDLNLTAAGGVSLVAGQALVYVPPGSASCDATAELAYTRDQAIFSAVCAAGGVARFSEPATLCLQPSPQTLAQARGNLANLAVTAGRPLASHASPSGVLVCAAVPAADTYTLSLTGQALPSATLHSLPKGLQIHLPAVGLGGQD